MPRSKKPYSSDWTADRVEWDGKIWYARYTKCGRCRRCRSGGKHGPYWAYREGVDGRGDLKHWSVKVPPPWGDAVPPSTYFPAAEDPTSRSSIRRAAKLARLEAALAKKKRPVSPPPSDAADAELDALRESLLGHAAEFRGSPAPPAVVRCGTCDQDIRLRRGQVDRHPTPGGEVCEGSGSRVWLTAKGTTRRSTGCRVDGLPPTNKEKITVEAAVARLAKLLPVHGTVTVKLEDVDSGTHGYAESTVGAKNIGIAKNARGWWRPVETLAHEWAHLRIWDLGIQEDEHGPRWKEERDHARRLLGL